MRISLLLLPTVGIVALLACEPIPAEDPDPGSCDADLPTLADYEAAEGTSRGTRPPGHSNERPSFSTARSLDDAPYTAVVGGRHGQQGLLLSFDAGGAYQWGRLLGHCEYDEIESVAQFADGAIAATTSFRADGEMHTELLGFLPTGETAWRVPLCTSSAAFDEHHAAVEIDHSDEAAVVAATCGGSTLHLRRVDASGATVVSRDLTAADLPGVDLPTLTDLAVDRFPGSAASDILLGFRATAVSLDAAFGVAWTFPTDPMSGGSVEVEACGSYAYAAATGEEFLSGEHVLYQLDRGGAARWSHRMEDDDWGGPQGVLRGDRFNLRCNEQDLAEIVMFASRGGTEYPREIVGATFLTDGALFQTVEGTRPDGVFHRGTAGVGASAPALLVLEGGRFSVQGEERFGWASTRVE